MHLHPKTLFTAAILLVASSSIAPRHGIPSSPLLVVRSSNRRRYYWLLLAEGHLTRRFRAMLGRIALLAVPIRKCSDIKIVSQYREQARCA